MTVILDPGNVTESYSDAQIRLWQATAGLWRGDARDTTGTVNSQTTPSWATGQLWRTTASTWETQAYDPGNVTESYNATVRTWRTTAGLWRTDKLAGDATITTRTSERDTARNSLYVSGTYLSGPTWQTQDSTDVATWSGRANNAWGASRVWNSGTSWETQATPCAAHAALSVAQSTPDVVCTLSGGSDPAGMRSGNTFVAQRTARQYTVSAWAQRDATGNGNSGGVQIRVNGSNVASSDSGSWNTNNSKGVSWTGTLNPGDVVDVTGALHTNYGSVSGIGVVTIAAEAVG